MKLSKRQLKKLIMEVLLSESQSDEKEHKKNYHSDHGKEVAEKHGDKHHVEDVTPKIKIGDGKSLANALTAAYLTQGGGIHKSKKAPSIQADILSLSLGNKVFNFGTKYDPNKNNFKTTSSLEFVSNDHGKHLVLSVEGIPEVLHSKINDYHEGDHDKHEDKDSHHDDINLGIHTAVKQGNISFTLGGHVGVMSVIEKHPHYGIEATLKYDFGKKSKKKKHH